MNQSGRYSKNSMQVRSEIAQARAALGPINRDLEKYKLDELRKIGQSPTASPAKAASFDRPRAANSMMAPPKAHLFRGGAGLKLPSINFGGKPTALPSMRRFGHGNALPDSTSNIWKQSSNNLLAKANPALASPIGLGANKSVLGANLSPPTEKRGNSEKKRKKREKKKKKKAERAARAAKQAQEASSAAESIQQFVKKKLTPTLAAKNVQRVVRGFLCRRYVEMVKSAQQAGVMVAIRGTSQGRSGWYQDFDGTVYFFAVDEEGTWWQVVEEKEWAQRHEELEGIPILVCQKGTKKGGMEGKFKEHGHPNAKRGAKTWFQTESGHWQRKKGLFG